MGPFYIWIGITFVLVILELILTSSFSLLCFSIGALIAALMSLAGFGAIFQIITFIVCSLAAFIFIRPFLIHRLDKRSKDLPKTNVEGLIGKRAKVVEGISKNHAGRVVIDGDNWQALSVDGSIINIGEHAIVESINSIVLMVRKAED